MNEKYIIKKDNMSFRKIDDLRTDMNIRRLQNNYKKDIMLFRKIDDLRDDYYINIKRGKFIDYIISFTKRNYTYNDIKQLSLFSKSELEKMVNVGRIER